MQRHRLRLSHLAAVLGRMRLSAKHALGVVTDKIPFRVPLRNMGWSWPLAFYPEAVPKGAARHPLSASAEVEMVQLPCG